MHSGSSSQANGQLFKLKRGTSYAKLVKSKGVRAPPVSPPVPTPVVLDRNQGWIAEDSRRKPVSTQP